MWWVDYRRNLTVFGFISYDGKYIELTCLRYLHCLKLFDLECLIGGFNFTRYFCYYGMCNMSSCRDMVNGELSTWWSCNVNTKQGVWNIAITLHCVLPTISFKITSWQPLLPEDVLCMMG